MAAENRDFGRFVTTWYNVHCKHTLFFEFFGTFERVFLEEACFWGVKVGFGGREGALASALIRLKTKKKIWFNCLRDVNASEYLDSSS